MKQKTVFKISGILSAAILSTCFIYDCTLGLYENIDAVSKFAVKNIFYINYENKEKNSGNNIYIEKDNYLFPETDKEIDSDNSTPKGKDGTQGSAGQNIPEPAYTDPNTAEMTLSGGEQHGGIRIKIGKDTEKVDFASELESPINIKTTADGKPTVLLYHTHTCECYAALGDDLTRSTDNSRNVIAVGEAIAKALESHGIGVIHDKTIYDNLYNGSYYRSEAGVLSILEKNPQIEITIDIHRDSLTTADGEKIRPIAMVDGKRAAQLMIITGCDPDGSLNFPYWRDNLRFSLHLQKSISEISPALLRPLYFCNGVYNMHLTKGSILVEFGTDASYPEEAIYAGELFGEALTKKILENSR